VLGYSPSTEGVDFFAIAKKDGVVSTTHGKISLRSGIFPCPPTLPRPFHGHPFHRKGNSRSRTACRHHPHHFAGNPSTGEEEFKFQTCFLANIVCSTFLVISRPFWQNIVADWLFYKDFLVEFWQAQLERFYFRRPHL